MEEREAQLAAFTQAAAQQQWHEFEWLVKAAYAAGATREELLAAIELGRIHGEVPEGLVTLVYAAVNAWQWMAIRRPRCVGARDLPPGKEGPAPPYADARD